MIPQSFQSTLPAGGATAHPLTVAPYWPISIHAPRGGSDGAAMSWRRTARTFQSTLPAGGATSALPVPRSTPCISIHAPRGGSDPRPPPPSAAPPHFNPRSPRGERLIDRDYEGNEYKFQSTLPAGGATPGRNPGTGRTGISIHAPRGGSDKSRRVCWRARQ